MASNGTTDHLRNSKNLAKSGVGIKEILFQRFLEVLRKITMNLRIASH
jgi:hypothetical protein